MNIFVLHEDPVEAALAHCDTHVVKMILETTQMLCTVQVLAGTPIDGGYRPTHQNHPCTRWIRESVGNYEWAARLLTALHAVYTHRFCKEHASKRLLATLVMAPVGIRVERTPFVFAGPPECVRESIVESYRALYRLKRTTMRVPMRWTKDEVPHWMEAP